MLWALHKRLRSCNSTYMKWWPKQDCIITQSTAPGRLMSVAKKTMSSPWRVVIDLWTCIRCDITCSNAPCHLQLAPGHGQEYGRNSQVSSWSAFSVCSKEAAQPSKLNEQIYCHIRARLRITIFIIGNFIFDPACYLPTSSRNASLTWLLISAWKHDGGGYFFHGQISNVCSQLASACWATC